MKRLFVASRGLAAGGAFRLLARVPAAGVAVSGVAAILLLGAPAAYAASTLYVNAATGTDSPGCGAATAPCQTIQQAVDNASDGDTIQVAAGTYGETHGYGEAVLVDKSLRLVGAQAGSPGTASRAAESPATESVVTGGTLEIDASDVTVDGFSFGYAGSQACISCNSVGSYSGVTIENDVFAGYANQPYGPWYVTEALDVNHATGTRIVGNYFTDQGVDASVGAVLFNDGGCSGSVVSDNTFYDAANEGLADIYFFCDGAPGDLYRPDGWEPTTTITVSGNRDTAVGSSDFALFTHVAGGATVSVTNNVVAMTSSSGTGIYFSTDGYNGGIAALDIGGNTLTGSPYRAVKLSANARIPGAVTVAGNDFSGNGVGVWVGASALAGGTVAAHANNLSDESGDSAGDPADGVYSSSSPGGSVDAADNWWGCNGGPGTSGCSGVSAPPVTYDPWLVLGVSASPSTLPAGSSSTVTADVTHDSAGADTSARGTIPDGTSIAFTTDFGTLSAPSAGTSGGKASVSLTSSSAGTANVSATLDSQTVSTAVAFTPPPRPTSIDQCKNGGWQSYGIFKNQGDCVGYVATRGKNPPGK